MLNTFPTLLSFAILVPFVFRICLALFLLEIVLGLRHKAAFTSYFRENKYPFATWIPWKLQLLAGMCAILLAVGFLTQITSLVALFTILTVGNANKHARTFKHSESAFAFVALICFSLLFLGAGAFAFDIPL
jgi:hypothetical protein